MVGVLYVRYISYCNVWSQMLTLLRAARLAFTNLYFVRPEDSVHNGMAHGRATLPTGSAIGVDLHDVLAIVPSRIRRLQVADTKIPLTLESTVYGSGKCCRANDGGRNWNSAIGRRPCWHHSSTGTAGFDSRWCRPDEAELLAAHRLEHWYMFLRSLPRCTATETSDRQGEAGFPFRHCDGAAHRPVAQNTTTEGPRTSSGTAGIIPIVRISATAIFC